MPKRIPGSANRIRRVCLLLNRLRVKYIIAGGVAVNLHGHVRATKDIDVLVPRDRVNTERLLAALSELPYGIAREIDADEVLSKPFTIIGDDPRVDILFAAGKVRFEGAWPKRVVRRILGIRISYLNLEDLLRSKETGRLQDQADSEALRRRPHSIKS